MFRSRRTPRPAAPAVDMAVLNAAIDAAAQWDREAAQQTIGLLADLDRSGDVSAARAALRRLSDRPRLISWLDSLSRRQWDERLNPRPGYVEAAALLEDRTVGPAAVALASTHENGHIRQSAVQRILLEPIPELMPFLVLRTADWVNQVRDAARAGFALLLHENPRAFLPASIGMGMVVDGWSRGSFVRSQLLAAALRTPELIDSSMLVTGDRAVRRFVFDAGLTARRFRIAELVRIAETSADQVLRTKAAEAAAQDAVWTNRPQFLERLAGNRHAAVRAVALTGLARAGREFDATVYLNDKGALVRAVARDSLRRNGIDTVEHYRTAVAAPDPVLGAIDGLTETGGPGDVPLMLALLDHPKARIRARALRGLRRLVVGADKSVYPETVERVRPCLDDPSPTVAREAVKATRLMEHLGGLST